jgi:hypothetical protein
MVSQTPCLLQVYILFTFQPLYVTSDIGFSTLWWRFSFKNLKIRNNQPKP